MADPNILVGGSLDLEPEPFIDIVCANIQQSFDQTFLIDANDDKQYTFGDLLQKSRSWAHWLKNHGLGKGDIISISSDCNMDALSVTLGTWLSGAAANPFNFTFTASDTKMMLQCTEPDIIYCSKNLELIEEVVETLEKRPIIVTPGGKNPECDSEAIFANIVTTFKSCNIKSSEDHIVSVLFTSGTTAIPKGILINDHSLKVFSKGDVGRVASFMITAPLFWISNLILFSISLYNTSVMLLPKRGTSLNNFLDTIQTYKPEAWFSGHSLLLDIAQEGNAKDYDLSSLKIVLTGGSIQFAKQRRNINEKVFKNNLNIRHVYGSTEVGVISMWTDNINIDSDEYNSVGTIARGAMLKVMDSSGVPLGPMNDGEISVKSSSMSKGYMTLKREIIKLTDESGWYNMGDLGYYDEKNLIYIGGRIKDVMKFRGIQISPAEIENVLNEHSDVIESCVVGKFDPINGDLPVAFVSLKTTAVTTVDALHEYLKGILAEVKRPHEIRIVDRIPKNSAGKPMRRELEKMLE